ncbi:MULTISPECIES: hypothetical protein [unclassified Mycolicibacterium]|uniref:hypothetical protein n=1 Tax=unclassified Mycolicibacterium TaxID=2636767 RepID=UPI001EE4BA33|nr:MULTISPECIES: hypothetical protein [unclassified Mycolicibacterium]
MPAASDVKVLAYQFLTSQYASIEFINWSIDRRVEGFLRKRGLARVANNGDSLRNLVDRVLDYHNSEFPVARYEQTISDRC